MAQKRTQKKINPQTMLVNLLSFGHIKTKHIRMEINAYRAKYTMYCRRCKNYCHSAVKTSLLLVRKTPNLKVAQKSCLSFVAMTSNQMSLQGMQLTLATMA